MVYTYTSQISINILGTENFHRKLPATGLISAQPCFYTTVISSDAAGLCTEITSWYVINRLLLSSQLTRCCLQKVEYQRDSQVLQVFLVNWVHSSSAVKVQIQIQKGKYTVYGRHLQANVGQCRNGYDEPQRISFAVIITITQGLTRRTHWSASYWKRKEERKKETKKQSRWKLKGRALHWPNFFGSYPGAIISESTVLLVQVNFNQV